MKSRSRPLRFSGSCAWSRNIRAAAAISLAVIVQATSASISPGGAGGENLESHSPIRISYPGSTEVKLRDSVLLRPQSTCRPKSGSHANDKTEKRWGFQDVQMLTSMEQFPSTFLVDPRPGWPEGLKFIRQDGSIRGTPTRAGRWHIITVFVNAYCRDSDQRSGDSRPDGQDVTVEFDLIVAPSDN